MDLVAMERKEGKSRCHPPEVRFVLYGKQWRVPHATYRSNTNFGIQLPIIVRKVIKNVYGFTLQMFWSQVTIDVTMSSKNMYSLYDKLVCPKNYRLWFVPQNPSKPFDLQ